MARFRRSSDAPCQSSIGRTLPDLPATCFPCHRSPIDTAACDDTVDSWPPGRLRFWDGRLLGDCPTMAAAGQGGVAAQQLHHRITAVGEHDRTQLRRQAPDQPRARAQLCAGPPAPAVSQGGVRWRAPHRHPSTGSWVLYPCL